MFAARPFVALFLLAAAGPGWGRDAAFEDDFDDGAVGPAWRLVVDEAAALSIAEAGGAARVTSAGGGAPTNDALYLSAGEKGFRLSTASAFRLEIDYSFTNVGGSAPFGRGLGLVFGVGADLDGRNSAAIGFGYGNGGVANVPAGTVAYRVDDKQSIKATSLAVAATGRFVIDYDPAADTLTFAAGEFTTPLVGLVGGAWKADALYVSFGARGHGFTAAPREAFFDDFAVAVGTLAAAPAPAAAEPAAAEPAAAEPAAAAALGPAAPPPAGVRGLRSGDRLLRGDGSVRQTAFDPSPAIGPVP